MAVIKNLVCVFSLLAMLAASTAVFAQAAPPINQCRGRWVLNTVQDMNFGAFAAETGSASVTMSNTGGRTTSGPVTLSSSIAATTWMLDISNSLDPDCADWGFTIDLRRAPQPLRGPGSNIPLGNIRVTIPDYGLTNVTLPVTIVPDLGNDAPFTVMIYGEITVNGPQTAGEYDRRLVIRFTQDTRGRNARTTVVATSIVPLGIVEVQPMDFGTIAGGPVAGTVILGAGDSRAATGDVQLIASGPGTAATFELTGEPNNAYSLSFGNGTLANAGGQLMNVNSFTHNASGTIPVSGIGTFQVGATLNVGSGQQAGNYSTTNAGGSPFTVTIDYN